MNSLTLVIYLADVIPSLSALLSWILAISSIVYAVGLYAGFAQYDIYGKTSILTRLGSSLKYLLPTWIILSLIVVLVPSKQTILLMAGSEFSEEVVNTPEAKELLEGVRQVIKSQLEQYTKKE